VRQQKAVKALQHAWVVFNDSNAKHANCNSNEEKFPGDGKQLSAMCGDATS
jgi:uncharacterized protein YecT (DUF1311 family)